MDGADPHVDSLSGVSPTNPSPTNMRLEVNVLIPVFPGFDLFDLSAMEVLGSGGAHVTFKYTIASHTEDTETAQGVTVKRDMSFAQAMCCIGDFHILIQPGGGLDKIIASRQDIDTFRQHLGIIDPFYDTLSHTRRTIYLSFSRARCVAYSFYRRLFWLASGHAA